VNASQPAVGDEGLPARAAGGSVLDRAQELERRRDALVREIEEETRLVEAEIGKSSLDERVLRAMRRVPRHEFVHSGQQPLAYENAPLPIGYGQTISQPFIVALMTDLLALEGGEVVLEVGTGCGYQSAVLAEIAERVYSVEIIPELAVSAQHRLNALGYRNVRVRAGDGRKGWAEHAPYDAVMVTAAADDIPPAIVEQLRPGGRLVIPLRGRLGEQSLTLVTKDAGGDIDTRRILAVAFVPLTGSRNRSL